MSAKNAGEGFTPARMTSEEFQVLGNFFKDLLAENPRIKWAIIAAGIGGALDACHVLWLFLKYLAGHAS
jgi:hypothetical protein